MVSTTATWLRGFVGVMMVLGLIGWASTAAAAPSADVVGNMYTSPRFGYTIEWTDIWFVAQEESTAEYDWLTLTDGVTDANLVGAVEAGGNAVIELAGFSASFRTDPVITNFVPMPDTEELVTPERAFRTYTYTLTTEDFSAQFALYIEAQTIEPGSSVLIFFTYTLLDYWETEWPLIQELASTIFVPIEDDPIVIEGEPAPAFVSSQWRIAVAIASLNDSFDDFGLEPKDGREWLVVIADVTNWSNTDGIFSGREFTLQPGLDGKIVKAAPGSSKSMAKSLGLEPLTDDELTVGIPAGETTRVVLVYTVPARSRELMLVRNKATLPLADALATELAPNDLPAPALPPDLTEGEFDSASDGRTVRVQFDGGAFGSQKLRLLGVRPPTKGSCYDSEAKKLLDDLVGQRVMVEEDDAVTGGSTDVRYLWIENADGTRSLINERLISAGLATVDKIPSDARFGAWLRGSQRVAEAEPTGLWLECRDESESATEEPAATKTATPKPTSTKSPTTEATNKVTATKEPTIAAPAEDVETGDVEAASTHDLTMADIFYRDIELVVPANSEITINLTNVGVAKHSFNIDALGVHSEEYGFGQKGTVTFETDGPGTYVFYCDSPGHKQAGMTGTLIVV